MYKNIEKETKLHLADLEATYLREKETSAVNH